MRRMVVACASVYAAGGENVLAALQARPVSVFHRVGPPGGLVQVAVARHPLRGDEGPLDAVQSARQEDVTAVRA